ncbi:SAG family member [Eimeria mitis]|uniref:SAG family member n=1 Tax=Eimeria mitis TaxID=44415 RepID=U6JSC5_9EIME|nr:SAG family member [Eimeria mitis]CDJ27731.1 SAG family member [Eimeria mitis]
MPALRLLTVASASLFLLAKASGNPSQATGEQTEYAVTLDHEGACLSEINAARKKAGFNDFIVAKTGDAVTRLPAAGSPDEDDEAEWVWQPVCDVLLPEEAASKTKSSPVDSGKEFASGTYAFQVVDANTPDCTAVVEKWKDAYSNINALPPPKKDSEDFYTNQDNDNVSFVAIYNPSKNATADCRVVTCTKKVSPGPGPALAADGSATKETKGFALICMTTPDVLSENSETAPFTEEQWGQIVTALEGSASAILPSTLGLAAVFLGVAAAL